MDLSCNENVLNQNPCLSVHHKFSIDTKKTTCLKYEIRLQLNFSVFTSLPA